jgi:hypothetical protein
LRTYPINGILIDEPRGPDVICFCSVCRALCPDVADLQRFRRRSMIDFLGELCACVKRTDTYAKTTIVLLPQDITQIDELAQLPHLDTIGCHLFWQLLHQEVDAVEEWGRNVVALTRQHHKRSQLWLQNFNLNESSEDSESSEAPLAMAFTHLLSADPDEIAAYYYWRNNEDPTHVWQTTRDLLRRLPRRQLYWQAARSVGTNNAD